MQAEYQLRLKEMGLAERVKELADRLGAEAEEARNLARRTTEEAQARAMEQVQICTSIVLDRVLAMQRRAQTPLRSF